MGRSAKSAKWLVLLVLVINILALGIFYQRIPTLRRPLDIMLPMVIVLGVLDAIVFTNRFVRYFCIVLASTSIAYLALEMSQKYFDFLGSFTSRSIEASDEIYGKYFWKPSDANSYFIAYNQAVEDGVVQPENGGPSFEEFFDGVDTSALITKSKAERHWRRVIQSTVPLYIHSDPLGYELNPGCLAREFIDDDYGNIILDAKYTINKYGFRHTRSNENADETYLFIGCSFTFGDMLSDNETLPYYFSEALVFTKAVINLGVMGWGPNQSLRDVEAECHLSKYSHKKVKHVFFTLNDDLARRMVPPYLSDTAPYYVLDKSGNAEFLGRYGDYHAPPGRIAIIFNQSRIYPIMRERLLYGTPKGELPHS